MEKKIRYRLGREDRLKSRKLTDQLFKTGNSFSLFPFKIIYLFSGAEDKSVPVKAGFSVSTRYFKKATDRNRVRRQVKESYRLQKHSLISKLIINKQVLVFFFVFTGNEKPEYKTLFDKTALVLRRLIKISDELPQANT